ncbi:hypothetical protein [Amycolatopsis sp. FDAARGOS 1241]|uniref:hypothetical protein n=1 Tax=Amycolatopsis sp. FDAARGOS 1241 TaxID=2778070 RepID=UPI00194FC90F|nr:hypothetical protein [Amycolatopsis sp. FDAARGOS 1241]QRP43425.1 hypothetical protein I6J71_28920 [Amycolatopsis sp. FDAARGOS 1241]
MTLDQHLSPTDTVALADRPHERFDAYYGRLFGWSVRRQDNRLFLALENGLCAVTLPKLAAGPVLRHLNTTGCQGPVLVLPTPHGPRVAILAETDGLVPPRATLPADADLLDCGALVPLPFGPGLPGISAEWLTAPDPSQRWLPSLSAVLAAVRIRH